MNNREIMQQALEALEGNPISHAGLVNSKRAITALRAALKNEFNPDWDQVEALEESLREYMAEVQRLRAALAEDALQRLTDVQQEMEAQQEPICPDCKAALLYECVACSRNNYPPQRKPLTDEQIEQAYRYIWRNLPDDFDHTSMGWIEQGIRYAEQAHGIGEKK